MNEILSNVVVVTTLLAVFAGLVRWVRRDAFSSQPKCPGVTSY